MAAAGQQCAAAVPGSRPHRGRRVSCRPVFMAAQNFTASGSSSCSIAPPVARRAVRRRAVPGWLSRLQQRKQQPHVTGVRRHNKFRCALHYCVFLYDDGSQLQQLPPPAGPAQVQLPKAPTKCPPVALCCVPSAGFRQAFGLRRAAGYLPDQAGRPSPITEQRLTASTLLHPHRRQINNPLSLCLHISQGR